MMLDCLYSMIHQCDATASLLYVELRDRGNAAGSHQTAYAEAYCLALQLSQKLRQCPADYPEAGKSVPKSTPTPHAQEQTTNLRGWPD